MSVKWHGKRYRDAIAKELRRGLERAAIVMQTEMKDQLNRSTSPSGPGSSPGKDTGTLGRSIQIDRSRLANLTVRIGTGRAYGKIQEFGGVIRPKRAKALPVPLNRKAKFMLRRAGNAGLRGLNLVYIPRPGRNPLLAQKNGKKLEFLFVLKKSVTLPARPWVHPSAKRARKGVLREIGAAVDRARRVLPGAV